MIMRPKAFCHHCYEKNPYLLQTEERDISRNGVDFSYFEVSCFCTECGTKIYVPAINDANAYARERAYFAAVERMSDPRKNNKELYSAAIDALKTCGSEPKEVG